MKLAVRLEACVVGLEPDLSPCFVRDVVLRCESPEKPKVLLRPMSRCVVACT